MKRLGEVLATRSFPRPTAAVNGVEPPDVCPICQGAGWLRANVPIGHPMFGRPIMCECLVALSEQRRLDELRRFSALEAFQDRTFANFDRKVEGVEAAYLAARSFARDESEFRWLILRGPPGCGKTHLAAGVANEAVARHVPVLFSVVPDLLDHLRAAYAPTSSVQYDEMLEGVRTTELLVLDDLGTENATPWAQEKLYQIINHRYNNAMPTVITTNRRLESLDERLVSRLCDQGLCKVVEIKARDYRALKPGQRRPGTPGRADRRY